MFKWEEEVTFLVVVSYSGSLFPMNCDWSLATVFLSLSHVERNVEYFVTCPPHRATVWLTSSKNRGGAEGTYLPAKCSCRVNVSVLKVLLNIPHGTVTGCVLLGVIPSQLPPPTSSLIHFFFLPATYNLFLNVCVSSFS